MKMKLEALSSNALPKPSDKDLVKSNRVSRFIGQQIEKAGNRISFRDFMQHALYEEDLGYYHRT